MRWKRLAGPWSPGLVDEFADTAEAAGSALKMAVLLEIQWARTARSVAAWIVVPRAIRSNDAMQDRRQPASELLVHAGVAAERVVCQLELVALAHEHAERAVTVTRRLGDGREAAAQQLQRRLELAVVVPLAEHGSDVLGRDAERAQPAADPLAPPRVESPAILGEALREGGVVDETAVEQLPDDDLGLLGRDALLGEDAVQLELGAVAPVQRAPRERPGALEPLRRIGEPLTRGLTRVDAGHGALPAAVGRGGRGAAGRR